MEYLVRTLPYCIATAEVCAVRIALSRMIHFAHPFIYFLDLLSTDTLFLQGNNLSGSFPLIYCPACNTCVHPLQHFGLDCDEVAIDPGCFGRNVRDDQNCFY